IESWESATYQKVNLHLSLIHNWIGQSSVTQVYTEELTPKIEIKPLPTIESKLTNNELVQINSQFETNRQSNGFEINEGHFVSLVFPRPFSAKTILRDYAEVLRRLFSILTG